MTTRLVGFQAMLQAAATYRALVAVGDGTYRVYPDVPADTAALPYSTWLLVTEPTHRHMTAPTDLAEVLAQVDHWAEDEATAQALADALRADLDHTTGTYSGWHVRRCLLEVERQRTEDPGDGSGSMFWNVQQELRVWYVRA